MDSNLSVINAFVKDDYSKLFRSCPRRTGRKRFSVDQKDMKINLRLYDHYETFLKISLRLWLRRISEVRTIRILLLHFLLVLHSLKPCIFYL